MEFSYEAIQSMLLGQKATTTTTTTPATVVNASEFSQSVSAPQSQLSQQATATISGGSGNPVATATLTTPLTTSISKNWTGNLEGPGGSSRQPPEVKQPAKITMNVPSFLMPKITSISSSSTSPNSNSPRGTSPSPVQVSVPLQMPMQMPLQNSGTGNPSASIIRNLGEVEGNKSQFQARNPYTVPVPDASSISTVRSGVRPAAGPNSSSGSMGLINPYMGELSYSGTPTTMSSPGPATTLSSFPMPVFSSIVPIPSPAPAAAVRPPLQVQQHQHQFYPHNIPVSASVPVSVGVGDGQMIEVIGSELIATENFPGDWVQIQEIPIPTPIPQTVGATQSQSQPLAVTPSSSTIPKGTKVIPVPFPQQQFSTSTLRPSTPTVRACSVPGCHSVDSNLQLFGLPRDQTARTWCQILGIVTNVLENILICENHFDSSQFQDNISGLKLKPNAMPSGKVLTPPKSASAKPTVQIPPEMSAMYPHLTMTPAGPPTPSSSSIDVGSSSMKMKTNEQLNVKPQLQQTPPVPVPVNSKIPSKSNLSIQVQKQKDRSTPVPIPQPQPQVKVKVENIMVKGNTEIQLIKSQSTSSDVKPSENTLKNLKLNVNSTTSTSASSAAYSAPLSPQKRPGPKCHRPELSGSEPALKVHLGAYARPNLPNTSRPSNITVEDMGDLVMPSEDWSVSIYASPKTGKPVYVISETLLNSDLVEVVRKSISLQPRWAMKFSVMSKDVSHFNLGLGVADISDVQAVLDNFDSFRVCAGCFDVSQRKAFNNAVQLKTETYVDKRCRGVKCALLLVDFNSTEKSCTNCQKLTSK